MLFTEIAWRWLFGGIAIALTAWAVLLFLRQVQVSPANRVLLGTFNPELMSYAVRSMFQGKWVLLARLGFTVAGSLSLLWILMATIGRGVMLRVLVEEGGSEYGDNPAPRANFAAVGAIHFLRVALLWIGLVVYLAASFGSSALTTTNGQPHLLAFLLIFLGILLLASVLLSFCNWILLLAPILAVRDHLSFVAATLSAAHLSRMRSAAFIRLNLAHLALRAVWFIFMTSAALVPLGFSRILPKILVWAAVGAVSLFYFAIADWLFVARYAGYLEIAWQDLHLGPQSAISIPVVPPTDPLSPVRLPDPAPTLPEPPAQ